MKLRIYGESLRFRLTRKEVAQLTVDGWVEASVELSPGRPFVYRLENSKAAKAVSAAFDGWTIEVTIPSIMVQTWAETDQVTIEGRSETGVTLLVEKDFQCLHKDVQSDPDAYPNPARSSLG